MAQRLFQLLRGSNYCKSKVKDYFYDLFWALVEADKSRTRLQSPFVRTKLRSTVKSNAVIFKPCLFVHGRIGGEKRDVPRLSNCSCRPSVISPCFSAIEYERYLSSLNTLRQAGMIYIVFAKASGGSAYTMGWNQHKQGFYEFDII